MSDQQQGPGWWLASDGKWYPPDQAPVVPPPQTWGPPPGPPPRQGMSSGTKAGIIAASVIGAFVVLIAAVTLLGEESTSRFSSTGSAIGDASDDRDDEPDPSAGGPVDVPEGFEVIEGDGVSIAAPGDWTVLDAGDVDMTSDEFTEAFPDAPPEMVEQGADMFAQGAVLVAFDFTDAAFASNVNIIDVPGEAPLGLVSDQAQQQIQALGGEVLDHGTVDVAVGEVARVEYTLAVTLPDGSTTPTGGVQFYVPLDGRTYIITVSSVGEVAELADRMIDTFRVG